MQQYIESWRVCYSHCLRYFLILTCYLVQIDQSFCDEFDEARKISASVSKQKAAIAQLVNGDQPNFISIAKKLIEPDAGPVNEATLCCVRKDYGLLVSKQQKRLTLVLQNPSYTARLSKNAKDNLPKVELEQLPSLNVCLDDFAKPDQAWFSNVVAMKMIGLYFSFGGRDFESALMECIDTDGVAQIADSSKDRGLKEISIQKWPGATSIVKYHYDPADYVIHAIEGDYQGGVHGTYQVQSFADLGGIRVPNCVSVSTRPSVGKEIKQEFRWELTETGKSFTDDMCYTTYYRLEEPNLAGYPEPQRSYSLYYWSGAVLLCVAAVFFLGRRIHA